ncbi:D-alanyl-D-alanine carboxypeptidase/D-alanyl-D-alanine-endopeptidase (penicillin-binding protein 4) [Chromohalobacter marismortui]|uniref:D-alanyl-D-alanine carboxypeptidase/D-alanyl-D-alanine-endopeptidase (Penicillin-binding protein 4) n=1 Tax=Chromohalobacter marismortui TaxID=42055 RepID=A0A4R7NIB7_9GAMM|nr:MULTISPECIES: D-alanyl-D-alanine carboxypeptidase/D-alanyl-D-alanine-endopeptidase [Chromohalobacter]MCI0510928.1 D-alanyl-D-alanine carboxypeptidase/D-alanyl-D-alanine-endopeptidase [Chromohalobacter sp.]MCI0592956.1 D-alanyl-D-alanine carboxypeptidase/D-alanyl-D-alanine-endopeptidase [Chromohalobacter sp.]TDU20138.1 D-alanyl-D-alanine carboxypeptidase/D-alanyl-D-alanine-endopeptidase (penicillin-binding protein 4) [Chromohalobacter marismortui]
MLSRLFHCRRPRAVQRAGRRAFTLLVMMGLPLTAQADGFDNLATLADKGFVISAQAQLLGSGESLGAIAPTRRLSPASVTKLYTAAASLDRWGPQHRFTTQLVSTGEIDEQGVLQGDLVFDGGGDPALTSENLWRLVQRLRERGVRAVDGQLVISQWRFGPVTCVTTDRCEARTHSDNAYSALLSSAAVNYGSWCNRVKPGNAVGDAASISDCATVRPLTRIDNDVETVPRGGDTRLSAQRVSDAQGDVLRINGQIARGSFPREIYRASSEPAEQTAKTLMALLRQAGIEVEGYAISTTSPPATAKRLAAVDGKPLQELLLRMLNYSNNFMADTLALDLVDAPGASLLDAGKVLERFADRLPGHGRPRLLSGSGLTPENRVSARGVNALLANMYQRPALFPTFVAGLQLPTNGPMHFIRRGSDTFQRHVMLKTGTLNEPVTVRAVAGYFRTRTGRWGSFAALVNGTSQTPYLAWRQVLPLVAADLTDMIQAH